LTRPTPNRIERWLAGVAAVAATIAWIVWYHAGLILTHYDAKAHLVVARRVFDNLTPGWQQIGAVWLPLPHLINLVPTQIDVFYRTGVFASTVSIVCFSVTAGAMAQLITRATGSAAGASTAVVLLALNPNLLYLHATPMTEPLLLAVSLLLVLWLDEWLSAPITEPVPRRLDAILFAAAWTRYEAWLVLVAALVLAAIVRLRRGEPIGRVSMRVARLTAWPAFALALFLLNSRVTVGAWFVSSGFYVPDPTYKGLIGKSALAVWWGTHQMSGYLLEMVALATAALVLVRGWSPFVALSLFSTGALPFYAFVEGHPFRIRYMIPLVVACAMFSGLAVGRLEKGWPSSSRARRTAALVLAAILVAATVFESPPWLGSNAPLIAESQWDLPFSVERAAVTRCLAPGYHGEKVLASMGSLAHYMQELSSEGFAIADFINEGNGTLWDVAMGTGVAPHAGWMLVEERAEGGDVLARRIRTDPAFARGMTRLCEGGGVALYGRDDLLATRRESDQPATLRR
jgi:hypothetical protein